MGPKDKQRTDFALVEIYGVVELVFEAYEATCGMDSLYAARLCSFTDIVQKIVTPFRKAFFTYYMGDVDCELCIVCKLKEYNKKLKNILIDLEDPSILWSECILALWERTSLGEPAVVGMKEFGKFMTLCGRKQKQSVISFF